MTTSHRRALAILALYCVATLLSSSNGLAGAGWGAPTSVKTQATHGGLLLEEIPFPPEKVPTLWYADLLISLMAFLVI